jgi:hypothetical protein
VGLGDTSAILFLRIGFGVGETTGNSAAAGDAALWAGGVASARFSVRGFGVDADSVGVPVSNWD